MKEEISAVQKEMNLRISISQVIGGGLFCQMEIEEIVRIIREIADDYEEKWKETIK
jgi:uncharacterized protein YeeX (DUF496 family)